MKKIVSTLIVLTICLTMTSHPLAKAAPANTKDYVTYGFINTGKQLIVTLKNTSSKTISLTIEPLFQDENGKEILVYSKDVVTFEPGRTAVKVFDNPDDYARASVNVTVSLDYYLKGVGITDRVDVAVLPFDIYNTVHILTSNKSIYDAQLISYTVLFYENGEIISAKEFYIKDLKEWSSSLIWFESANNDFKIILNEAYY